MAEKEAWPGAGIDFEFEYPQEIEIDRVVRYVEGLPNDETKLRWITRYFIECEYRGLSESSNAAAASLLRKLSALKKRIEAIAEMENAAAGGMSTPTTRLIKHGRAQPEEFEANEADTAQRVMVLYYLALAATDGEMINKSALGRLLRFFTGQKPDSTKDHWQNPAGKKTDNDKWTPKSKSDREAVKALLTDLGATKAIELMNREEN